MNNNDSSEARVGHHVTDDHADHSTNHPPLTPGSFVANAVRGALIGIAETIPGVSGGTIALITGIYERLISSAKSLTDVPKELVTGGDWRGAVKRVDWWLLVPLALGMAAMVFSIAGLMESFVTDHPIASKALFFGMIAASVVIPFQEIRPGELDRPGMKGKAAAVFIAFAVALFWVTSIPSAAPTDPSLILVFFAAAVAVCALALPGVSGSFFLLLIGLYAPTMAAVDTLNIPYLAAFMLGAVTGIALFVRFLEWMLETHHALTLVAMAGLLLGSLRALWPWQGEDGSLQAVGPEWPMALGLFVLGAAVVGVVAWAQTRFSSDEDAK
ncbi:DUF368 domain-containing protein [Corynebacterium sp. 335C]